MMHFAINASLPQPLLRHPEHRGSLADREMAGRRRGVCGMPKLLGEKPNPAARDAESAGDLVQRQPGFEKLLDLFA